MTHHHLNYGHLRQGGLTNEDINTMNNLANGRPGSATRPATRPVSEWTGESPWTALPLRVKLRILARQASICAGPCGRKLGPALKPEYDHRPALINGGSNRESMIVAVCKHCHGARTKADVAEKSAIAATQAKHLGLKQSRWPMPGSRRSKWKKKIDGSVVRR